MGTIIHDFCKRCGRPWHHGPDEQVHCGRDEHPYRVQAEVEPQLEDPDVCAFCGGKPHDLYACMEQKKEEARRASKRAQGFALFTLVWAILGIASQVVGLALQNHWWGLRLP